MYDRAVVPQRSEGYFKRLDDVAWGVAGQHNEAFGQALFGRRGGRELDAIPIQRGKHGSEAGRFAVANVQVSRAEDDRRANRLGNLLYCCWRQIG